MDCSFDFQASDHNDHSGDERALSIDAGMVGLGGIGVTGGSSKVCMADSLGGAESGFGVTGI
jgi:hypothetical protein